MKVKPLKNHLLIKLVKKENETKSGIILVGKDSTETDMAEIVEIAESHDAEWDTLLKGDSILVNSRVGTKVNIEDEEHLIIHQKDVLAIVKEDK